MTTLKQIYFACVFTFALLTTATAQDASSSAQRSSLTITAAAAGERVRITAPSSVVQMRVEVYAVSSEKLFDQEIRGGNVFDWHLQNGQAQRLAPGNYVCVVTAKSVSGRLTQKIGSVRVEDKSASVQPAESKQLSAPQAQTIGPVEENSSWTIAAQDELQTPTVIANDGTDGHMIRGRGALTFRIGDFFSGADKEQMRLTEEGNLGIGTSEPKAMLDVAGTIRAQRFLISKPNRSTGDIKAQATDDADSVQPLIAGTGTQNRIAKWIDNAGTLGDSAITEIAGNVGIGTTTPGSKLVVSANSSTLPPATGVARFADADGGQTAVFADAFSNNAILNVRRANGTAASPSALQANQLVGVIGASGYGASAYMGTRARVAFWASEIWTNTANGTYLTFNTTANGAATPGGTERMRIDNAGNVGIGMTPDPNIKLDVSGSTRVTPGNGYSISFGAPNGETGMTLLKPGISRADVRFNGTTLSLLAGLGVTPPCCGIVISTDGNVGIGTPPSTGARLGAVGGTTIGVHGDSTNSNGVYGTSLEGPGVYGFSTNNSGVFGRSTNFYAGYFAGNVLVEGTLTANGNVCAANVPCASDARLKQNVTNLHYGLHHLLQLRPVSWQWRDPNQRQPTLGLVAQEVEQVLPELILHSVNAKDSLGLNYMGLIPVLVKGIQEQQDQIDALRIANTALISRLRLIERSLKNMRNSTRQSR